MTKHLQFTLTMYKVRFNCFLPVTNVSKLFEIFLIKLELTSTK